MSQSTSTTSTQTQILTTKMSQDLFARLAAPIESARLWLEPLRASHAAELFEGLQEPELYRWISMNKPSDVNTLAAHWQTLECRHSPDGQYAWPIWILRRKIDGCCIGRVDAEIAEVDAQLLALNFGYYVLHAAWGQGYASEAVQAAVAALHERGVRRMISTVTVGNIASTRVLQKAGFVFNRILQDNDCINGHMHDDEEYVWQADGISTPTLTSKLTLTPQEILKHWPTQGALWLMEEPLLFEKQSAAFVDAIRRCEAINAHQSLLIDIAKTLHWPTSRWEIRAAVAGNRHTPASILEVLATDTVWNVRAAVAGNRIDADLAAKLVTDVHWVVRQTLAFNAHIPQHIIAGLANDADPNVRDAVANRPVLRVL